ncbi:MAG: 50S ribosomal protein L19e [Candidatus Woesearchaeota archaeon]
MDLKVQKRLAAQIFDCSPDRVVFDNDRLEDIKQAITKRDLKLLMGDGAITKKPGNFTSKFRSRKLALQKHKGRRKGEGSKKGKFGARFKPKRTWMNLIRIQREFLKLLLDNNIITRQAYRELYLKSKGGYFRSKRHIKLYLAEHDELLVDKEGVKKVSVNEPKGSKKIMK